MLSGTELSILNDLEKDDMKDVSDAILYLGGSYFYFSYNPLSLFIARTICGFSLSSLLESILFLEQF